MSRPKRLSDKTRNHLQMIPIVFLKHCLFSLQFNEKVQIVE